MQHIYNNQQYLNNNPTWHQEDAAYKASKVLQLLQQNKIELSTVAEVGCGSGEILVQLAQQLPQVQQFVGYDISADAIQIATQKQNNKIKFYCQDFTQQNVHTNLLLVMDVLEHLENYFDFLKNIQTKSDYTIFHIPLDMCVWALFREVILLDSKNRVGHIHNFTEQFITQVLQDYGFIIVNKMYTPPLYTRTTLKEHLVHALRKALFALHPTLGIKIMGGYSVLLLAKNK